MANTVDLKFRVLEDGSLVAVGKKAQEAANRIQQVGTSAQSADRAMKGTAQISSNTTKNFAKMAQGITTGLVPAYATLAANVFAISAAFNFLRDASDVANLEKAQVAYAQNTGVALKSMSNALREASGGMLGFREAAQATAIGVAKGFSPSQMESLAEGARKASTALGRDFEDSFDRLVRGASKAEPELLDELGITLRLETATKNYATAIGKSADQLTAAERSQAVLLETQRQLDEQFGDVETRVNPFIKLSKTFQDIVKQVTQFILPAFEAFATFLNNNASMAALFFGAFAVSIAKTIPGVQSLTDKIANFGKGSVSAIKESVSEFKEYRQVVNAARSSFDTFKAAATSKAGGLAADFVNRGSDSMGLTKLAVGDKLTKSDTKNLQRALKSAEKQYKNHGKIVTGIFAGEDIQRVRNFEKAFSQMNRTSASAAQRMKDTWKSTTTSIKIGLQGIKVVGVGVFRGITGAARVAGKAVNYAMRATIILGVIKSIYEGFQSIMNAPYTLVTNVISMISSVGKGIQFLANLAIGVVNDFISLLPESVKKILGLESGIGQVTFADGLNEKLTTLVGTFVDLDAMKTFEDQNRQAEEYNQRVQDLTESYRELGNEILTLGQGLSEKKDPIALGIQRATAISTIDIAGKLRKARATGPEAIQALQAELKGKLGGVSAPLAEALQANDLKEVERLQSLSSAYIANLNSVKDGITNIATQVKAGDLLNLEFFLNNLMASAKAADEAAAASGELSNAVGMLDKVFEGAGGTQAFLKRITDIRQVQRSLVIQTEQLNRQSAQAAALSPMLKEQADLDINSRREKVKLMQLEAELQAKIETLNTNLTDVQRDQTIQEIQDLGLKIQTQTQVAENAKRNATDVGQIMNTVSASFESNMSSAFNNIIQGTESIKDAFGNMAIAVLQSLSQIIAKLIAVKIIEAGLSIFGFGGGGATAAISSAAATSATNAIPTPTTISARYGGVVSGYSVGGVARGPDAGYPAILHGTEAVVPLPNGKSIPVQMSGGAANNVTVNVAVDNQGNAQTSMDMDDKQAGRLGAAISQAVQMEIQKQKRPGGMLSPYGAA